MKKKELNFEINILPILDILSVMICFLLLTAVWVQLGTLDVRQAVGDNSLSGAKNPPSLWAQVAGDGSVQISLRDVKSRGPLEIRVSGKSGAIDWAGVERQLKEIKVREPSMKTGIIRPEARAVYGDVIRLMDQLRRTEITDVGLSPLS